jgi:hypothetical protein
MINVVGSTGRNLLHLHRCAPILAAGERLKSLEGDG